jgi:hypothetical protein
MKTKQLTNTAYNTSYINFVSNVIYKKYSRN